MIFGNEETYILIGNAMCHGDMDAYNRIGEIIVNDTMLLVNSWFRDLQSADKEDIVQDVAEKMLRGLLKFYEDSNHNTEQQRNAYLKTAVYNACMDFFRKAKRSVLTNAISIDKVHGHVFEEDFSKRCADKDAFLSALKGVFQIHTTPDKMIAFVYNRLLGTLTGKNGSPKSIIAQFDGMPIQNVYEQMVCDLSTVSGDRIPDGVLSSLRNSVYGDYYNHPFHMTPHQIADSSNWIVEKTKEKKNEY